jgi:YfiH family protein
VSAVPIVDARLAALPGIRHGFFTRAGGVSSGIYAALNCGLGSKEDRAAVMENRGRVAAHLGVGVEHLVTPYQVHGTDAVVVETPWRPGEGPKADAIVTDKPGIAIAVGTADCGPVLLADPDAGVVGAAHAGWRGALAGVTEATITAMEARGARRDRIVATLGPTISQPNYEVGPEVRAEFVAADRDNARFFIPSDTAGRFRLDLPAYLVARLASAGVSASSLGLCTYAEPARFYSYRRATHRGEPDYGRLLSAIVIAR